MNEYQVTLSENGVERTVLIEAATAADARDIAEEQSSGDVINVRFLRALSFSCRIRD